MSNAVHAQAVVGGDTSPCAVEVPVPVPGARLLEGSTIEGSKENAKGQYVVDLGFFCGPLDLLLHLVRAKEVPIEQVEMADIAEQYLRIVAHSAIVDLESATEYLVVASTLLAIKSRLVLPGLGAEAEDVALEESSEEFYEQLRERLRQYEITQRLAGKLVKHEQLDVDVFVRRVSGIVPKNPTDIEEGQDPVGLAESFLRLLKRIGHSRPMFRIHFDNVSVVSYMMNIVDSVRDVLSRGLGVTFRGLMRELYKKQIQAGQNDGRETRRSVIIGSFVAVLELAKRGLIGLGENLSRTDPGITLSAHSADLVNSAELDLEIGQGQGQLQQEQDVLSLAVNSDVDSSKLIHMADYLKERADNSPPGTNADGAGFEPEVVEQDSLSSGNFLRVEN